MFVKGRGEQHWATRSSSKSNRTDRHRVFRGVPRWRNRSGGSVPIAGGPLCLLVDTDEDVEPPLLAALVDLSLAHEEAGVQASANARLPSSARPARGWRAVAGPSSTL